MTEFDRDIEKYREKAPKSDAVVYVDMVGDLFHKGHVNVLKTAKEFGSMLVVGVHNDETVRSYKRSPVLSMKDRIAVIAACRYVDKVVPNAPLKLTERYLDDHGIDIVVHGDDLNQESFDTMYGEISDRICLVKYTSDISTTDIIRRIKERSDL